MCDLVADDFLWNGVTDYGNANLAFPVIKDSIYRQKRGELVICHIVEWITHIVYLSLSVFISAHGVQSGARARGLARAPSTNRG